MGQFRDLVEAAERNKALRETLKQVGAARLPALARRTVKCPSCCPVLPCAAPCCSCCGMPRRALTLCLHHVVPSRLPTGAAAHQGLGHCARPRAQGGGDGCAAARVPPRWGEALQGRGHRQGRGAAAGLQPGQRRTRWCASAWLLAALPKLLAWARLLRPLPPTIGLLTLPMLRPPSCRRAHRGRPGLQVRLF